MSKSLFQFRKNYTHGRCKRSGLKIIKAKLAIADEPSFLKAILNFSSNTTVNPIEPKVYTVSVVGWFHVKNILHHMCTVENCFNPCVYGLNDFDLLL